MPNTRKGGGGNSAHSTGLSGCLSRFDYCAFSLAEMMVVMLIMSIVLAAMAPVITTRIKADEAIRTAGIIGGNDENNPWAWTENSDTDAFSKADRNMIGQKKLGENDGDAKLILNQTGTNKDHILFKKENDILGHLKINKKFLQLGTIESEQSTVPEHAVIIGFDITGKSSTAGDYSVAIGTQREDTDPIAPISVGTRAVSIGNGTQANGNNSVAIGPKPVASGLNAIAIGYSTQASGDNTLAMMRMATASNTYAIAIGTNVAASGDSSIAMGMGISEETPVQATKNNSIAIGRETTSTGQNGISIGTLSVASGTASTALGTVAKAAGNYCTAIGYQATATYNNSIAIGRKAASSGESSLALGYFSSTANTGCVALGNGASSSGEMGVALGSSAAATGARSISIGNMTTASDWGNVSIGTESKTPKAYSVAIGSQANAGAIYTNVLGIKSNAGAKAAIGIGAYARANGENSIAIGSANFNSDGTLSYEPTATGNHSVAIGSKVKANADYAVAIGYKAETSAAWDFLLGSASHNVRIPGSLTVNGTKVTSDKRLKYIKGENKNGLDKIRQMKVYNFTFKKDKDKEPRVGVIAQELQKILPDAVKKGSDGFLTIRIDDIIYTLVNAVKELDRKVSELTQTLKQVQAEQKRINQRLDILEQKSVH